MKGFKDTTRTCYVKGGPVSGLKGAAQAGKAMKDFRSGSPGKAAGPKRLPRP